MVEGIFYYTLKFIDPNPKYCYYWLLLIDVRLLLINIRLLFEMCVCVCVCVCMPRYKCVFVCLSTYCFLLQIGPFSCMYMPFVTCLLYTCISYINYMLMLL